MKKKRIIPVLLLKDGFLVQSKLFNEYKRLGNPLKAVERFSEWDADELIYLDISPSSQESGRRTDLNSDNFESSLEVLKQMAKLSTMPITFGGGIKSVGDIEVRLSNGADKISINSVAIERPAFVSESAERFGSQCIVVSVDVVSLNGEYFLWSGEINRSIGVFDHLRMMEDLGAGEILLNVTNRDGTKEGYDINLLDEISKKLSIPVIALGGVGNWSHMAEVLQKTRIDAVAAANIFHHTDQSIYHARKALFEAGLPVRPPTIMN
jgi:cyclase